MRKADSGGNLRINIENRKELNDYLVKHQQFQKDELTGFQLLSGGVSNRTVMVRLADGKAWVIKQALEKLRVKTDWFCDPARIYSCLLYTSDAADD